VKVVGTLRTFSDAVADEYEAKIKQTLDGCTQAMGATYEFELKRGNSPMMNSPALNRFGQPVLESVLGSGKVKRLAPGLYGEDFSQYQKVIPGTMFFLGIANPAKGITGALHTAEFDLDEGALANGVRAGASLLVNYLMKGAQ
jgi:metal-dependent amidase/aminoacylase/carboxypeptidase family protein